MDITVVLPFFVRKEQDIAEVRRLLFRALDSVLEQEYPGELEVLIIDDGAEVPVERLLHGTHYSSLRQLHIFKHCKNYGLVHALNTGLVQAKCELIARMDADDKWSPGKIEKQMKLYAQDPDLSIAATGMRILQEPPEDHVRPGSWSGVLDFFVEVGCPFPHGSILARKDVYLALGGYSHDPRFRHCEDYELWGRWVRFFKPAMVEEVLFDYSWHPESVSNRFGIEQANRSRYVCSRMLENPNRQQIPADMAELSASFCMSLLDTGFIVHAMWNYMATVVVPVSSLRPLQSLLYDRHIEVLRNCDIEQVITFSELAPYGDGAIASSDDTVAISVSA